MNGTPKKVFRCAIYTRKSTEHNLDLEFNSLDAQREACEAETVRMIFTCYLELGSVQALAQDLDRRGIRTKQRQFANGRIIGGGTFGVGGLAHLLRNRFYIGEVVYRGEAFRGDHDPILDPALFAAVHAKLSSQGVERRCRI